MRAARIVPALVAFVFLAGCDAGPPVSRNEVVIATAASLPEGPGTRSGKRPRSTTPPSPSRTLVEPRLLVASTATVRVQAATDGSRVAFRLAWEDPDASEVAAPARFSDACAVQLPQRLDRDLPAPQMGEPGKPVEVAYWRASWQRWTEGREDAITSVYPRAAIDHYPAEAPSLPEGSPEREAMASRYSPARALGNVLEGPRERPVEDLVAEGPGTLAPRSERSRRERGRGRRRGGRS
jgi:Ethylbenzene dehydrogenase.